MYFCVLPIRPGNVYFFVWDLKVDRGGYLGISSQMFVSSSLNWNLNAQLFHTAKKKGG